MRQITHAISDIDSLERVLSSAEICSGAAQALSILVQVYTAQVDPSWIHLVANTIAKNLAAAVVVGATSVAEIVDGSTLASQTAVGFTFFKATRISAIAMDCRSGDEHFIGQQISQRIDQVGADISGVLLLATTCSINATHLLGGLKNPGTHYPIFGGGAGEFASTNNSLIFSGSDCFNSGVVAVVLCGTTLHIESRTYLGWQALSKEMTVTEADGLWVKTVDGKPAFETYRSYLDISNDENFFLKALAFPFLLERDHTVLARAPVSVDADGSLRFSADVNVGEKFRIGYGDPDMIVDGAANTHQLMRGFEPEVIFLYSCNCRRLLMEQEVELELSPFQKIAPTFGIYTHGEFHGQGSKLQHLNLAMVAVGLREGPPHQSNIPQTDETPLNTEIDPQAVQHALQRAIHVSRKSSFIGAVTTELEEVNREFMLLITEREKVERMKSEFISVVSHELRTPLTAIFGSLDVLAGDLKGKLPEQAKVLVDIAHKSSQRLILLVNDILDMDKIEVGKMEFDMRPVNIIPLLEQALQGNRAFGEKFNVSYGIESALSEAMIKADSNRLLQVFANLLSNAAKFSPVGGKVLVAVSRVGERIRVEVKDNGIGIPDEFNDRIFQKFFQVDSANTRKKGGTGLGLSITKSLVEQMGGSIGFASQPNVLTTFFVEFQSWHGNAVSATNRKS